MSSRLAATMEEEEEEEEDRSLLADVANASSLLWEEESYSKFLARCGNTVPDFFDEILQ